MLRATSLAATVLAAITLGACQQEDLGVSQVFTTASAATPAIAGPHPVAAADADPARAVHDKAGPARLRFAPKRPTVAKPLRRPPAEIAPTDGAACSFEISSADGKPVRTSRVRSPAGEIVSQSSGSGNSVSIHQSDAYGADENDLFAQDGHGSAFVRAGGKNRACEL